MKFAVPAALAIALTLAAGGVVAKTMTPQQQKMSTCSKDAHAKGLKGKEYKSFMSTCLKGHEAAATEHASPKAEAHKSAAHTKAAAHHTSTAHKTAAHHKSTAQQEKMKTCSTEAKSKKLKGTARKEFMSSCLKG